MKKETSQLTNELDIRILTNKKFGGKDLTSWLIKKLNLKAGEKLLDIGCGTGKHLIPFAKKTKTNFSCVGLDISKTSLKEAEKFSYNERLKIRFIEKDMDKLDCLIGKEQYDIITAIYSAYYAKNIETLLENTKKLIKKDGRIVIMGPYSDNNKLWFDFLNQFMTIPEKVMESTTTFMPQKILPFAVNDFEEVKCFRFVNPISIQNIEYLKSYWESNIYYDEKLDKQFKRFAEAYFNKNKEFSYNKVALLTIMKNIAE